MTRIAPLAPEHRAVWDALAAAQPGAGFMQSWAWSAFKELEGYTAARLGVADLVQVTRSSST